MQQILMSVPVWGQIVALLVVLAVVYRAGRKDLLPIPFFEGRRTVVRPCASVDQWLALIHTMEAAGDGPRMFLGDDFALRAFFADGLIINVTRPEIHLALQKPEMGIILHRGDPQQTCNETVEKLTLGTDESYAQTRLICDPDAEVAKGALCFFWHAFFGPVILGARKHAFMMGQSPQFWNWAKVNAAVECWRKKYPPGTTTIN